MTNIRIQNNINEIRRARAFFHDGKAYPAAPANDQGPRVMIARFASKCSSCGEQIQAGEQIRWWGDARKAAHGDAATCDFNRREAEARAALATEQGAAPAEERTPDAAQAPVIRDGYYTVVLSGEGRRTLRLKTSKEDGFGEGQQVIAFLSGSDNEASYTNFGFVNESSLRIWKRFQNGDSLVVKAARALLDGAINAGEAGAAYALESGNCWICGRRLTTPESIKAGIGPDCAKKQ